MAKRYNLFNNNVIQREVNKLEIKDKDKKINILKKWSNKEIKNFSESEIKFDFIIDVFVEVLGYERFIDSCNEWSLNTEKKTETDSTKADGVIGAYSSCKSITVAVLEIKSPAINLDEKYKSGQDFKTPVDQAFLYATKNDGCKWVIVSNFNEVRLYKVGKSQAYYEMFLVNDLHKPEYFKKFYLLLSKDNLLSNFEKSYVERLFEETDANEKDITNDFYLEYKQLRIELINTFRQLNPDISLNEIIRCSQKILDRIIFIVLCEAKGLLEIGLLKRTLKYGKNESLLGAWGELKVLFIALDEGRLKRRINQFNGELFKKDNILDHLIMNDSFLNKVESTILQYDFTSELNVTVLGHIFEQSITDLEELRSDFGISDTIEINKKRRKAGIYYTPESVVNFIVKKTLSDYLENLFMCSEKEAIEKLDSKIINYNNDILHYLTYKIYHKKVKKIKVLDPACGSGGFLVEVLECLKRENIRIKNEIIKLQPQKEKPIDEYSLDREILENNIFGVDLNEESIEITKLSLWLNSASKDKPLVSLNNTIKCGNSIISDLNYSDRHFNWGENFTDVINEGGFDIIIGNPPYLEWYMINSREPLERGSYYGIKYKCRLAHKDSQPNLYIFFIILAMNLLKPQGRLGFITSQEWLNNEKFYDLKEKIFLKGSVKNIAFDSRYSIFKDSNGTIIGTNSSITFFAKGDKEKSYSLNIPFGEEYKFLLTDECSNQPYEIRKNMKWNLKNRNIEIFNKIKDKITNYVSVSLNNKEYFDIFAGFMPKVEEIKMFELTAEDYLKIPVNERTVTYKAIFDANEIDRYSVCSSNYYWIVANDITNEKELEKNFDTIFSILDKRIKDKDSSDWYKFPNIRNFNKFISYNQKIISPRSKKYNAFTLDIENHIFKGTNTAICVKKRFNIYYVLAFLNSALFTYCYQIEGKNYHGETNKYEPTNIKSFDFKIPLLSNERIEKLLINNVQLIFENKMKYLDKVNEFNGWLNVRFSIKDFFGDYFNYSFQEFCNLNFNIMKRISPQSLKEIKTMFEIYAEECRHIRTTIRRLDRQIDYVIFKIYDLDDIQRSEIQSFIAEIDQYKNN